MFIFDHTVKPVLLYSSEILGIFSTKKHSGSNIVFEQIYNLLPAEKLNLTTVKPVLRGHLWVKEIVALYDR